MRVLRLPDRYDLPGSLGMLRLGGYDPTTWLGADELWRASRTPAGPGTIRLVRHGDELHATAAGPGAEWLLDRADALAGLRDDPTGFTELSRAHPLVARLAAARTGLRIPRTERVYEELLKAVLGQKVTGIESRRSYNALVRRFGEPAPGAGKAPVELYVPPAPETLAGTPYWALHPLGVEAKRASTLLRASVLADRLEEAAGMDPARATARLTAVPGIGPWTAAEVTVVALGDPDAVSVGDWNLPHLVSYALAGEPRGDDARMLELLAPFAGHRARVMRLLATAGIRVPQRAPRAKLRSFAAY